MDPARFRAADQLYPGHWQDLPAPWPSPEREALSAEIRRLVADAVDRLPARQRAVITLRDIEGHTAGETCALLDISRGATSGCCCIGREPLSGPSWRSIWSSA